jgi:hypothetical protein
MKETFEFTAKLKKNLFYMMGAGVVGLLILLLYPHDHHARLWSNILACTYYFTGIGLFGMFAVSAGQIAYGSWQTLEKRIFLSLSAFVRVGSFMLVAIVILGVLGVHTLYAHVDHIIHSPVNPETTTKVIFFAPVFWIGRIFLYAVLWTGASIVLNNFFARTDQTDPKVYKRSKLLCAAFIVIFAVTESFVSWDVIMSLDTGWYSTLFGWYNFASYGCGAWAMTILLVIFLKSQGYLSRVNDNHVHDLGKLLFGFSIFWSYLWFDQFMLQWFANIPEETSFWVKRFGTGYFTFTVFLTLAINFAFPLLVLMTRGAKRNFKVIGFAAAVLILGHYVDFFNYTFVESGWNKEAVEAQKKERLELSENATLFAKLESKGEKREAVGQDLPKANQEKEVEQTSIRKVDKADTPGEVKKQNADEDKPGMTFSGIGIGEILVFIGFLGAFLYMFFNNLAKRPIIPENDPYLQENEKLEVVYS